MSGHCIRIPEIEGQVACRDSPLTRSPRRRPARFEQPKTMTADHGVMTGTGDLLEIGEPAIEWTDHRNSWKGNPA